MILCLNGGSSSLKFATYDVRRATPRRVLGGAAERIGLPEAHFSVQATPDAPARDEKRDLPDLAAAVKIVFEVIEREGVTVDAVGHRIVHGGPDHLAPARIDAALVADLRRAIPFAPLHIPGELALIEAVQRRDPSLPQVACFDTGFHARLPPVAQRLAIPSELHDAGVRRYGFHGLSYEYIVEALGPGVRGRVVIAHLGNGASMVALRDGSPLDTTMGFTPAGGLVMGTRPGDLDPGVVLHLRRTRGLDDAEMVDLIHHHCGLVALSETTSDMQTLLRMRGSDPRAALAVESFCMSARKWIGAFAAVLGGLDALVFTGGIGEHAALVREEICRDLGYLGITLDPRRNAASEAFITPDNAPCAVRVIPTDEDLMIARHTAAVLA